MQGELNVEWALVGAVLLKKRETALLMQRSASDLGGRVT